MCIIPPFIAFPRYAFVCLAFVCEVSSSDAFTCDAFFCFAFACGAFVCFAFTRDVSCSAVFLVFSLLHLPFACDVSSSAGFSSVMYLFSCLLLRVQTKQESVDKPQMMEGIIRQGSRNTLMSLKEVREVLDSVELMYFNLFKQYQATCAHMRPEVNCNDYELLLQKAEEEVDRLKKSEKKLKNDLAQMKKTLDEHLEEKQMLEENVSNNMQVSQPFNFPQWTPSMTYFIYSVCTCPTVHSGKC